MKRIHARLRNRLGSHGLEVLQRGGVAIVVKVLAAFSTLILNLVVARSLEQKEAGRFFLCLSVMTLASAPCRLGFDRILVKSVSAYQYKQDMAGAVSMLMLSVLLVTAFAGAVTLASLPMASLVSASIFGDDAMQPAFTWFSAALLPYSLVVLLSFFFQGQKRTGASMLFYSAIAPIIFILVYLLFPQPSSGYAAYVFFLSCCIALILAISAAAATPGLFGALRRIDISSVTGTLRAIPHFTLITFVTMGMQWAMTILVGLFLEPAQVAEFSVAQRASMIVSFVLLAVNSIVAPKVAAHHATNAMADMQNTVRVANRLMLFAAIPLVIGSLIFAEEVMHIFGAEYGGASHVFRILVLAQFVNVCTGSVGVILMMTGHEAAFSRNLLMAFAVLVVGGVVLIPLLGLQGAAIVMATAVILQNLLSVRTVRARVGINTLA